MAAAPSKYSIVLFCNKKRVKLLYQCKRRNTIHEHWREYKTQKKPPYVKEQGGAANKRHLKLIYELVLIYPMNRWATKTYVKDSLGRLIEAKIDNDKFRIKEIVPYWKEEFIYDFQIKKRIRYHEVLDQIIRITDIAQVFTL